MYKIYEPTGQNNKLKTSPRLCLNGAFKKTKDFFSLYQIERGLESSWVILRPGALAPCFLSHDDLIALDHSFADDIKVFGRRPHPDFLFLLAHCVSGPSIPVVATAGCGVISFVTSSDEVSMLNQLMIFVECVKATSCCAKNKSGHIEAAL